MNRSNYIYEIHLTHTHASILNDTHFLLEERVPAERLLCAAACAYYARYAAEGKINLSKKKKREKSWHDEPEGCVTDRLVERPPASLLGGRRGD
jgi:hypothetical protein